MKYKTTIEQFRIEIESRSAIQDRVIVAIAGPPGSGKSTLVEKLAFELGAETAILPMDGFHLDNQELASMKLLHRKGAPETFDVKGFVKLVRSLRDRVDLSYPTFDRNADETVPFGATVSKDTKIVLIEGNYLLLERSPWNQLADYFDLSAFIEVPKEELEARLIRRWIDHGFIKSDAKKRAQSNDMKNADFVNKNSIPADFFLG